MADVPTNLGSRKVVASKLDRGAHVLVLVSRLDEGE